MGLITETRRAMQDSPREIFNLYVLFCTCAFALSGVAKGFDEGEWLFKKNKINKYIYAYIYRFTYIECSLLMFPKQVTLLR
jgi:hypothetical protein